MDTKTFIMLLVLLLLNIIVAFSQPLAISVDEGQYLLVSKKMLEGWVPYRDIIENKPLGAYLSLIPAVLLCGTDFVKLRLMGALIVSLTSSLIFLIGKKLKNNGIGIFGALVFIYLEAFPGAYGYNLMTEPMANLAIVAIFYILLCAELSYRKILFIGTLSAIACSIKQTSVFIFVPIVFSLVSDGGRFTDKKTLAYFLGGVCLVIAPMLIYLAANFAIDDAAYWTFFGLIELGGSGIESKMVMLGYLSFIFFPLVFLSLLSLRNSDRTTKIIWTWLLSALVLVQLGYSWLHSYLFIAPPLSILASLGIWKMFELRSTLGMRKRSVLRGMMIILFFTIFVLVSYELIEISKIGQDGRIGPNYPSWKEQKIVSEFISSHTKKGDGIFVFRNNVEIYYLSDREPVTRMTFFFFDELPRMSKEEMAEFVFRPLEERKPEYFVFNTADFEVYKEGRNAAAVRDYLLERYDYVMESGPLRVYRRKTS